MTRTFEITFDGNATLVLEDAVIDAVDDSWRASFYDLVTPEQIAEQIAFNLLRGWKLHQLDGWADQPDSNARLIENPNDVFDDLSVSAIERNVP